MDRSDVLIQQMFVITNELLLRPNHEEETVKHYSEALYGSVTRAVSLNKLVMSLTTTPVLCWSVCIRVRQV